MGPLRLFQLLLSKRHPRSHKHWLWVLLATLRQQHCSPFHWSRRVLHDTPQLYHWVVGHLQCHCLLPVLWSCLRGWNPGGFRTMRQWEHHRMCELHCWPKLQLCGSNPNFGSLQLLASLICLRSHQPSMHHQLLGHLQRYSEQTRNNGRVPLHAPIFLWSVHLLVCG